MFHAEENDRTKHLYNEVSDGKTFYRTIYFDVIDTVTNRIQSRKKHWATFLNVVSGLEYQNQLEDVLFDYGEVINPIIDCQQGSRFWKLSL